MIRALLLLEGVLLAIVCFDRVVVDPHRIEAAAGSGKPATTQLPPRDATPRAIGVALVMNSGHHPPPPLPVAANGCDVAAKTVGGECEIPPAAAGP